MRNKALNDSYNLRNKESSYGKPLHAAIPGLL